MMLYGVQMKDIRKLKAFAPCSLYGTVVSCSCSLGRFADISIPGFCER